MTAFCDPLELRSDSLPLARRGLWTPSLQRNVHVANALGSGVIESAAIMPFAIVGLVQDSARRAP